MNGRNRWILRTGLRIAVGHGFVDRDHIARVRFSLDMSLLDVLKQREQISSHASVHTQEALDFDHFKCSHCSISSGKFSLALLPMISARSLSAANLFPVRSFAPTCGKYSCVNAMRDWVAVRVTYLLANLFALVQLLIDVIGEAVRLEVLAGALDDVQLDSKGRLTDEQAACDDTDLLVFIDDLSSRDGHNG